MLRWLIAFGLLFLCPVAQAQKDFTVRDRTIEVVAGERSNFETVRLIYLKGAQERVDTLNPEGMVWMTLLTDREQKTSAFLLPSGHVFRRDHIAPIEKRFQKDKHNKDAVLIESTTIDTGERKVFFGFKAKHLITTNRRADTHAEETVDGWYVDQIRHVLRCGWDYELPDSGVFGGALVESPQFPELRHSGPEPTGFAVKLQHVFSRSNGKTYQFERSVEELRVSDIPESLFQVPGDFKEDHNLMRK